jgi:hypothetical protein
MTPVKHSLFAIQISATPIGDLVIYLLLGLFAIAAVIVAKNILRVRGESRSLKRLIAGFDQMGEGRKITADELIELVEAELPKDSIVASRIRLLYKIRQMHSISADLLTRLDALDENDSYRFVRFVSNVLLILGLLGTVIGLTISVQSILPALEEAQKISDIAVLTRAMAETLAGLRTAFYATMAGLGSTFTLALLVMFAQRYEAAFHRKMELFLAYDLMPEILISTELEASTLYVKAIEKSAQDIAQAATVLDSSRDGIQIIVDGLVQATRASESRIVDFFNFAHSCKDSVSQMIGYNDDLKKVYGDIQSVLREIQKNQVTDKIIGQIVDNSVARSLEAANEGATAIREEFKKDIAEITKSQQQYVEAVNKNSKAIEDFSQKSAERLAAVLDGPFKRALEAFEQGLQRAQQREDVSRTVATEYLDQLRAYVVETSDKNRRAVESLHAQTGKMVDQFQHYIQESLQSMEGNRAAVAELITQSGTLHGQLLDRLNNQPSLAAVAGAGRHTAKESPPRGGDGHVE